MVSFHPVDVSFVLADSHDELVVAELVLAKDVGLVLLDAVLQLLPRLCEPRLLLLLESVVLVPRMIIFDHLVVGRVVLLPLVDRNLGCVGVWVLLRLEVLRKAKERADDGCLGVLFHDLHEGDKLELVRTVRSLLSPGVQCGENWTWLQCSSVVSC